MGKNIVLAGLQYDNNLGDQAIFLCARIMLDKVLRINGIEDMTIRGVDMAGRTGRDRNTLQRPFRYLKKLFIKIRFEEGLRRLPRIEARYISARLAKKRIDRETAAVVFAGGGIVKYRYQQFHIYIDEFTKRAEKLGIPVMLNAVGIEGYDADHPDCRLLKNALNRSCVKYISTRDDIDLLRGMYCANGQETALVADPACSLSFFKPARKRPHVGRVIGLGVVRAGLFTDNDIDFPREDMLKFWSELVREIESRGMKCRIFSNGTRDDTDFQNDLASYMGLDDAKKKELMYERPTSVRRLVSYLCGFDAVITGRLHASIIAYSYGVPSVGLVWNDKQRLFGRIIGHPERFIEPADFTAEKVIDRVEEAMRTGSGKTASASFCGTTAAFMNDFVRKYICTEPLPGTGSSD